VNFRRKTKPSNLIRLPMAALIDVVLFMLMYFIMAGTLAPAEGELPATLSAEKRGSGRGSELASQVLRVTRRGQGATFALGSRSVETHEALVALLRDLPKEPGVIIRVDDDVQVEFAAGALQAARAAGFTKVSYVVARP
jgi:biopolymer transport protein ExbD